MVKKLFLLLILFEIHNGFDLVDYQNKVLEKLNEIRKNEQLPLLTLDANLNRVAQSEADNVTDVWKSKVEDDKITESLSDSEAIKTIEKWAQDFAYSTKNYACSNFNECQESQNFLWKNSTKLGVGVSKKNNQLQYTIVLEPGDASQSTNVNQKFLLPVVAIVLAALFLLIVGYFILHYRKSTSLRSSSFENEPLTGTKPNQIHVIIITRDELVMESILGEGAFGIVYSGIYKATDGKQEKYSIPVAIKLLKINEKNNTSQNDMLEEAKIMAKLKHEHLLRLVGVALFDGFKLITVRRSLGSLENYLRKQNTKICPENLMIYCYQISCAMAYLAGENIVHRDLATRNVLLRSQNHVEVTDFGLAKMMNKTVEDLTNFPAFWMAPESLTSPQEFSESSDVWAFGVTCWEIFTYGDKPMKHMPGTLGGIVKYLEDGKRLPQSKNCKNALHFQLLSCWQYNPSDRPNFNTLEKTFLDLSNRPTDYISNLSSKSEILKRNDVSRSLLNLADDSQKDTISEKIYIDKNNQKVIYEPIETFDSNFSNKLIDPVKNTTTKNEGNESQKKIIMSNFAYI